MKIESSLLIFVWCSFLLQLVLIAHFALRKWAFESAIRYGRIVYALAIPAFAISLITLSNGKPYWFWLGGVLCLLWAIWGYWIDYMRRIEWRVPFRPVIGVPYLLLFLAMTMFYWFPLGLIAKPLWYLYGGLFVISTILNVTSHRKAS